MRPIFQTGTGSAFEKTVAVSLPGRNIGSLKKSRYPDKHHQISDDRIEPTQIYRKGARFS